jgi:preprotein translocase subunit SecG
LFWYKIQKEWTGSGFFFFQSYMGVRKTADFLEKATWGLIAFIVFFHCATAFKPIKIGEAIPKSKNSFKSPGRITGV